jgi:hypothetical protein
MTEILNQFELTTGEGCVILYNWDAPDVRAGRNLALIHEGRVLWTAVPPHGRHDCFTSIGMEAGQLIAHTWSCYKVWIDKDNGTITAKQFTK